MGGTRCDTSGVGEAPEGRGKRGNYVGSGIADAPKNPSTDPWTWIHAAHRPWMDVDGSTARSTASCGVDGRGWTFFEVFF